MISVHKEHFTKQQFDDTCPAVSSLWMHFVINPIRRPLALFLLNHTNVKPIHLSLFNALCATIAFLFFIRPGQYNLVIGGVIAQTGFLADSIDGVIARLKNNGSPFGIISDSLCDLWRILLLTTGFALGLWLRYGRIQIFIWAMALLFIYVAEAWIPLIVQRASKYYSEPAHWRLNALDLKLIRLMQRLEKKGLRLVLYGFNEREALIFLLGPLIAKPFETLIAGTLTAFVFLSLRLCLDIALLKRKILSRNE